MGSGSLAGEDGFWTVGFWLGVSGFGAAFKGAGAGGVSSAASVRGRRTWVTPRRFRVRWASVRVCSLRSNPKSSRQFQFWAAAATLPVGRVDP